MTRTALARAASSAKAQCSHNGNRIVVAEVLKRLLDTHRPHAVHPTRRYSAQSAARHDDPPDSKRSENPPTARRDSFTHRARRRLENKEFFTSLLSSAATKRDAKAYISRLKSAVDAPPVAEKVQPPATTRGAAADRKAQVNLGSLYGRSRAVEDSPVFTQYESLGEQQVQETLHVALVKISSINQMPDDVLEGIAKTLASLSRLSMAPCVVIEDTDQPSRGSWRERVGRAADRLVAAIDNVSDAGARRIDNMLSFANDGRPRVFMRKLLTRPLRRGAIPIVLPLAYSDKRQHVVQITADEAMIALVKELAGLNPAPPSNRFPDREIDRVWKPISLDRVIVVDETGAIPSTKAWDKKHVFVNLEQEYAALQEELRSSTGPSVSRKHATNLKMFRDALHLLPPSSSGLLTTPAEAANTPRAQDEQATSVGTRRSKNPLIHNILTDKPAHSSSLPSGRLARDTDAQPAATSTFIKRGMPLIMLPNPAAQPWTAASTPRLRLTDTRIDLKRLAYLIDDSFNRTLDVEAYLNRVNDRIAGVIIAGEYEGGAILTWETPPGVPDTETSRLVPYLDKFAVLKKAQGAGGVADIVFNAMVRTCFPNGVCWRSRKDNPVNKWYFERSRGTWKIPDTNWTMFWTTPGILAADQSQVFLDYEGVCRSVEPTWADGKKIAD